MLGCVHPEDKRLVHK